LFDCLHGPNNPDFDSVIIPAQPKDFTVGIAWGGYDKSAGTPQGSIDLYVDGQQYTTVSRFAPEPGDDDRTFRWRGETSVKLQAGRQHILSVRHSTNHSNVGNTFLTIWHYVWSDQ
jgi:hypothetical protein